MQIDEERNTEREWFGSSIMEYCQCERAYLVSAGNHGSNLNVKKHSNNRYIQMYLYLLKCFNSKREYFDVFVLLNPSAYIEIAQVQLPKEIAVKRTFSRFPTFCVQYTQIWNMRISEKRTSKRGETRAASDE